MITTTIITIIIIVIRIAIITIIAIAVNQYTWAMVLLSYYWEGNNICKWLLLSHKRHQDHYVEILLI